MCGVPMNAYSQYTCELCKQPYIGVFTDEYKKIAEAEALVNFGYLPAPEDQALVCNQCHQWLMAMGFDAYCRDLGPDLDL